MKYNLSALKTNSHVKINVNKMLQLHDLIQNWNEIKDIDEERLHTLVHEAINCDPFLYKKLDDTWQEIYKFLDAQVVLAHRVFFEGFTEDDFEYHRLAAHLCKLHDFLTAQLVPFAV